jgi:hypothetical protein
MLLVVVLLPITGCGASTSDHGTVLGSFIQVGGPGQIVGGRPAQPRPVPMAGHVIARSQSGSVFTVTVGKSGRFEMLLPPGTYRLIGYSPMYPGPCAGESAIKVRTGKHVTHIDVICVAA